MSGTWSTSKPPVRPWQAGQPASIRGAWQARGAIDEVHEELQRAASKPPTTREHWQRRIVRIAGVLPLIGWMVYDCATAEQWWMPLASAAALLIIGILLLTAIIYHRERKRRRQRINIYSAPAWSDLYSRRKG